MPPLRVNLLYDVEPTVLTLCKQGANRKRIFLKKALEDGKAEVGVESARVLRKADGEDWSYFYCVVAEPGGLEDPGVGDGAGSGIADLWRDEDEIRKAAHFFASSPQLVTGLHDTVEPFGKVVETSIAPADFDVLQPGGTVETIRKGSWYVGIAPSEEGKRKIDQGEFTGLSLEGTGYRELRELSQEEESNLTLLQRLAKALGVGSLASERGTVDRKTEEELDVADTDKIEGELAEIRKAQTATTTAVTELAGIVQRLLDDEQARQKKAEKKDDDKDGEGTAQANPADLKKSIDELTETVNGKLDELDQAVTTLADQGSAQHDDPDTLRKEKESDKDSLAFLLD